LHHPYQGISQGIAQGKKERVELRDIIVEKDAEITRLRAQLKKQA